MPQEPFPFSGTVRENMAMRGASTDAVDARALAIAAPAAQRATIVLCSHRLAAFPLVDMVVVLDQGRIVEQGTHAALLRAGGVYARIHAAQAMLATEDRP